MTNFHLTEPGVKLIVQFEGYTPFAYNDPIGFCTAGPGILLHRSACSSADLDRFGTRSNPKISKATYYSMLDEYTQHTLNFLEEVIKVPVTQPIINALVSLVHNIGESAFRSSTVLRELNASYYRKAARAILMWDKAGGQVLAGLTRRRRAEMQMFLRGTVKPVNFTEAEQTLMRRYSNQLDSHAVSERELRLKDRLHAQASLIGKAARQEKGGWEKFDRRRRYQAIRRLINKE